MGHDKSHYTLRIQCLNQACLAVFTAGGGPFERRGEVVLVTEPWTCPVCKTQYRAGERVNGFEAPDVDWERQVLRQRVHVLDAKVARYGAQASPFDVQELRDAVARLKQLGG